MDKEQQTAAIIVAAGESRRMDGMDKILVPLGGRQLMYWSLNVFQGCTLIDLIVLVVNERNLERGRQLVARQGFTKVTDVCLGGERRQDSVVEGLARIGDCEWVIIHDGARPLVTAELIERGMEAAEDTGAAIAAVPVKDTIKVAGEDRVVRQTLPRQNLWAIQTPQVFRVDIIKEAYQRANDDVTDDASLVEKAGGRVTLYMGSYDNIKVTTPEDLILAEALLHKQKR
ncbi:2-C-methyl-D-erythritol 4-phosphate cytidylyltransferase [Chloroflexota bacterium]